ncbi:MAG: flagellar biosynthesis anti-sigma factor FlgM [Proteobacteria bacterium]|uniref:Negative regulator of flagellin synthesis n=1 Tax=Candidatus Avisuccinivibrio stercorigallinarum TaxID=2840704 RepID=A0A9D9D9P1_9GAMM|nr:flagellar biosynthesis anti-sigma factor FlgM [Candidatus Avisuccinivibrio stercorigallinarum]
MAIDMLSDFAMKSLPENASLKRSVSSNAAGADQAAAVRSETDEVSLTASAQTLARATDKAKAADGMNHEKIERLRQAVADGSYQVNYESIASKIVDAEDELSSIFG